MTAKLVLSITGRGRRPTRKLYQLVSCSLRQVPTLVLTVPTWYQRGTNLVHHGAARARSSRVAAESRRQKSTTQGADVRKDRTCKEATMELRPECRVDSRARGSKERRTEGRGDRGRWRGRARAEDLCVPPTKSKTDERTRKFPLLTRASRQQAARRPSRPFDAPLIPPS